MGGVEFKICVLQQLWKRETTIQTASGIYGQWRIEDFEKEGFQYLFSRYTWRRVIKRARLGGVRACSHRIFFFDFDLLLNLVIVFEAIKRSQKLKTSLRLSLQRLQSSREARERRKFLASCCNRSVVALWNWEIHELNTSVWLLCISSVSRSVRSYVCMCRLTLSYTRRQPFKIQSASKYTDPSI